MDIENNQGMEINPDFSESMFAPLAPGRHAVRVMAGKPEDNQYQGPIVLWELQTFGNLEDPKQNGKKLFHRTPIKGQFSGTLRVFLMSANPDYSGGKFNIQDFIGRELEIEVFYPINKNTGQPSAYPSVKRCMPYVGNTGTVDSLDFPT